MKPKRIRRKMRVTFDKRFDNANSSIFITLFEDEDGNIYKNIGSRSWGSAFAQWELYEFEELGTEEYKGKAQQRIKNPLICYRRRDLSPARLIIIQYLPNTKLI